MTDVLSLVHELHRAIESGTHGDELGKLFTADAVTVERPNLISPGGRTAGLEQMLAASTAGTGLLAEQTYDVFSDLAVDDTAIVRLTWTGKVAADAGPFRAGQVLTAHIAQFVTATDGRISRIETYDCYEPFTS
jgi:ketosteroid isomerase-like protein